MSLQILRRAAETLTVKPLRNPCEWARENRVLPIDSAEPGPFRPERTPYIEPIARTISSGKYRRITVVMGAQGGKTDLALNTIGQRLDDDPCPVLFIAPTRKLVESISRDRFAKMVKGAPSIAQKVSEGGLDNLTEKFVAGVALRFLWSRSATELSSHPAGLVIIDERDRMPDNVCGEGDPLTLAEARTATYPDALILVLTTPTIEGESPGWSLWEGGTAERWAWPCVNCENYFVPKFELLRWEEGATKESVMLDGGAWVECPECQHRHHEKDKNYLNNSGAYLSEGQSMVVGDAMPEPKTTKYASFWVSGLASPWRSFGQAASDWLEAVREGRIEKIKAVINTSFGELFKVMGEGADEEDLNFSILHYDQGQVYDFPSILTAGVDVQKDCLYYVVRAWGKQDTSWLVKHGQIYGDTMQREVWEALSGLLDSQFETINGEKCHISLMAIDSGYRSDVVYDFCKARAGRAIAANGTESRPGAPVLAVKLDVNAAGKKIKGGLRLWHFDKHFFRSWIYTRMKRTDEAAGRWFIPNDATADYQRQIIAEEMIVKPSGRIQWRVKKGFRENHYLDAEVHARLAAHILNVSLVLESGNRPRRAVRRL